jgi:hypothetical protein
MLVDVVAGLLVFPAGESAKWLGATIDPNEIRSRTWRSIVEDAVRDGLVEPSDEPMPVRAILENGGRVTTAAGRVEIRAAYTRGDDEDLLRATALIAAFERASAHAARGTLYLLGSQPPYSDDAFDWALSITPERALERTLSFEDAMDTRSRLDKGSDNAFSLADPSFRESLLGLLVLDEEEDEADEAQTSIELGPDRRVALDDRRLVLLDRQPDGRFGETAEVELRSAGSELWIGHRGRVALVVDEDASAWVIGISGGRMALLHGAPLENIEHGAAIEDRLFVRLARRDRLAEITGVEEALERAFNR